MALQQQIAFDWNEQQVGRKLDAPLWFLDPGRAYVAEIYRDGDGASCGAAEWVP